MAAEYSGAYPVNGEVVVTVTPDFTSAFLTLYPPKNGGKEIRFDDVTKALSAKAVSHNIKVDLIREMVDNKVYDKEYKVAEADAPVNGEDGSVTYHYSAENVFAPKEDEKGFVDYKNLGFIRVIHKGEVIAEIMPPTEGIDGMDIRGSVRKAIPGKPANFKVGSGTYLSDNGLTILATHDGNVCYRDGAFCVDTTVTISADVDASVGNIDFIGDVVVKGEVMEGFSITSGKDIVVSGNVTNATLKAEGNITVKKGAINSRLNALGDISCQFTEYSDIRAEGNVTAQDFVICNVFCGGSLTAKALNGGKYIVIGNTEIRSALGTKNYAPTEVIAGNNAMLNAEMSELKKKISDCDVKLDRCVQIIDFLNEKRRELKALPEDKEELLGTMVRTKIACQMEKKTAHKRISEIEQELSETQFKYVSCKGTVYPGVRVTINNATTKFDTETTHVKIYLNDEGEIVTGKP